MKPALQLPPANLCVPVLAALASGCVLQIFPSLEHGLFVRASAWLASVFTASPLSLADGEWCFDFHGLPMVVTTACSATDYLLVLTALLGWQFTRLGLRWWLAASAACSLAVPLTLAINTARLVTLAIAHRWFIPLAPPTYEHVLHLLLGVVVFLSALIALNALLEYQRHGRTRIINAD